MEIDELTQMSSVFKVEIFRQGIGSVWIQWLVRHAIATLSHD